MSTFANVKQRIANMKQLQGIFCKDCKIFTDNVEDDAIKLIQSMLDHRAFEGSHVRIMPDVHMGKGITIITVR